MSNNATPTILINQLILIGHRKNYAVPFKPGVNIIYGDADTGKSSILDLINYLFGSKSLDLFDEIESSVDHCVLDVELNSVNYVIKRDIHNKSKPVEVYQSTYDAIDKAFAKKYVIDPGGVSDHAGLYSDFLLQALNLPNIKVKNAPTKPDSDMSRLSFRDIFKYCYLKQDDVGSKKILDLGSYSATKTKQTFKYIYGLLDTNIADLEEEVSMLSKEISTKESKYKSISEFLIDTQFDSQSKINRDFDELEDSIAVLEQELNGINKRMTADSAKYSELKEILNTININVECTKDKIRNAELAIERYLRLKNDYLNDVEKLKSIEQAKNIIGQEKIEFSNCPICDSEISIDDVKDRFEISVDERISHESNSLKRRIKELGVLVDEERSKHRIESKNITEYLEEQMQARRLLDDESKEMITPYISERDGILSELSSLREKKKQFSYSLKVRSEHSKLDDEIKRLNSRLESVKLKLQQQRKETPTVSSVTNKLGTYFYEYLDKVHIKNCTDISISQTTFLPVLRGRDYENLTSGGLRTIASIGYFLAIFKDSLDRGVCAPRFLMIDTVGKYLGKTKDEYLVETDVIEDQKEDVSDPSKYKHIYEYIIDLTVQAEEKGLAAQIILVDNDVPPNIQAEYAGFVVRHFSSSGKNDLPIGLIDDYEAIKDKASADKS